jgi:uncharacterized protein YktB (UPF0637 family)
MSSFNGFTNKDFDVFTIPGLDERMKALKENVSPKLEAIAEELSPTLTALTGDEMIVHVAKHLRRTKNPPKDTWAALANSKRGYKQHPHFQIGMWESHLFIWFAVIYESPIKQGFGRVLKEHKDEILQRIPANFVWSGDHTKPDTLPQSEANLEQLSNRLETVKKAEILCGRTFDRSDKLLENGPAFLKTCEETFEKLGYLYDLTKKIN